MHYRSSGKLVPNRFLFSFPPLPLWRGANDRDLCELCAGSLLEFDSMYNSGQTDATKDHGDCTSRWHQGKKMEAAGVSARTAVAWLQLPDVADGAGSGAYSCV